MNDASTPLLPEELTAADPLAGYRAGGVDRWRDGELARAVAEEVARPKVAVADSFVLHAPLELLARLALLAHVDAASREQARVRIAWLGAKYREAGDAVTAPARSSVGDVTTAVTALVAAVDGGDLDEVDRLAVWIGDHATALDMRRQLGETVVVSLAAAAHGSILLSLLPAVAPPFALTGRLLRGPVRELARNADWRLCWFDDDDLPKAPGPLADALLEVPHLGVPGSDFIYPVMHQAEESGLAASLLAGLTDDHVDAARSARELTRVAAWSMLQEDDTYAPYGWSHCLTMPQAVLVLAGDGVAPRRAVEVAATHVVGFRAAMGKVRLAPDAPHPRPPTTDRLTDAIAAGREEAAAFVWHADAEALPAIAVVLATKASLHHDAHLVKYTLACLHAAARDPAERRLYLAAAASLAAYWAALPGDGLFPDEAALGVVAPGRRPAHH